MNICLVFHSIRSNKSNHINKELAIELDDLESLIFDIKVMGYKFSLHPIFGEKTCSITFDDGYFSTSRFLPLAEKYKIPFTLFPSTYNLINDIPFIWDINSSSIDNINILGSLDYEIYYSNILLSDYKELMTDDYRPFTVSELNDFCTSSLVHLGSHGHLHRPFIRGSEKLIIDDLAMSSLFLSKYSNFSSREFAFPSGLYTRKILKYVLTKFDRIYTINGGLVNPCSQIVNRISIINPLIGGKPIDQIKKGITEIYFLRRKISSYYCSYRNCV